MSFCLVIDPNLQILDGLTFVGADQFSYQRESQNLFIAKNESGGPLGVVDPMAMLQTIEDEKGALFDRAPVEAGSPVKITDLIVERVLVNSDNPMGGVRVGTHSPPQPGFPNGVRLFTVPTPHLTATSPWVQFGGSGQLDQDPDVGPGGCVTLPTGLRMFFAAIERDPPNTAVIALWLVPFKSPSVFAQLCCCASKVPPPVPPPE